MQKILVLLLVSNLLFASEASRICRASNYEIVKNSLGAPHFPERIDLTLLNRASFSEILSTWDNSLWETQTYVPWMLMNHPRSEVKEVAHHLQKYMMKKYFANINPDFEPDLDQYYTNFFSHHSKKIDRYSSEYLNFINQKIDQIEDFQDSYSDLKTKFDTYSFYVCSNYVSISCNQSLPRALDMLNPKQNPFGSGNGGSFSLTNELRTFLTSEIFIAPLNLAALKVKRILRDSRQGKMTRTHLFKVIYDSFTDYNFSRVESEKLTWLTLGVYATRGSAINSFLDLVHPENAKIIIPLYYISTAINLIDHYLLKDTVDYRTFTLPASITTSCDYAKPYHFWLTAYLARSLRLQGFSPRVSALTPHILGLMYQFAGIFSDMNKAFTEHKHSPSNQAVRVNLSFNDLGAIYGSGLKWKIFHNDLLIRMSRKAKTLKISNKKEFVKEVESSFLRKYYYWDQVISPSVNFATILSN